MAFLIWVGGDLWLGIPGTNNENHKTQRKNNNAQEIIDS